MAPSFRTILSPINFDENSLRALETTGELARLAQAAVIVLHVVAPPGPRLRSGVDASAAEEKAAAERLTGICRERLSDLHCEVLTRTGDPAIVIIRAAVELKADLVVIATHADRGKPTAFAGSVAERVIREAICPVVTVRATAGGDLDAVGSHMTPAPATISPDTTVARVRQMMARDRFRCLPVLEKDELVGIVSDRDIAFSDATPGTTIGLLMTRDLITIESRTSIQEAARLLVECEVDGLPVVDGRKLVGIITRSDILKVFADLESARFT